MDGITSFFDHGSNHMVQWGRITLKTTLDLKSLTLTEDCGTMIRHGSAQNNFIPRTSIFGRNIKIIFKQANAGSIDKYLVRLAGLDHLGVACNYLYPGFISSIL